jgi:hypothetical protein
MSRNKPPSDDLLAQAAELRAGGLNWEAVAAKVGRAADTVRRWPTLYPDRWQAVLHAAERRLVSEAGAESVLVLRQLLRSDDEKVRRDAARFLVYLRLELAKLDQKTPTPTSPHLTSDAARLVAFLEGHTDEQLEQFVAERRKPPADGVGDQPDAVARPG